MTVDQLRARVKDYEVWPLTARSHKACEINGCHRKAQWYIEWEPTFRDYCCTRHLVEAERN